MHRIPRPLLRAATAASLLVLAGMSAGAQAQTTMRPASTDTTQAPTRTPPGARGEDPHYPASGTQVRTAARRCAAAPTRACTRWRPEARAAACRAPAAAIVPPTAIDRERGESRPAPAALHDARLDASGRSDEARFDAVTRRGIAPASDAIARIAVGVQRTIRGTCLARFLASPTAHRSDDEPNPFRPDLPHVPDPDPADARSRRRGLAGAGRPARNASRTAARSRTRAAAAGQRGPADPAGAASGSWPARRAPCLSSPPSRRRRHRAGAGRWPCCAMRPSVCWWRSSPACAASASSPARPARRVERDGAGRADRLHHAAGGRARAVRGGRAASLKRGGGPLAACFARRRGMPPSMPLSSPPRRPA